MSHVSRLLGNGHKHVDDALDVLHATLDGAAHDVQLIGDIAHQTVALKRKLRLDPQDTTALELYHALRHAVSQDNERLAKALGIAHPNAVSEVSPVIIKNLQRLYKDANCFVPKTTALKALLKDNPPKKLMNILHYRSIDSMLKHESSTQLVVLARYLEDAQWQEKHHVALSTLTSKDFELRQLEIVWLDKLVLAEALAKTAKRHHFVLHAKEAGCVAIGATTEKVITAYTIRTFSLMLHYIQEVLYASTYAKTILPHNEFGVQYSSHISDTRQSNVHIASHQLPWRAMHKAVHASELHDKFPPHIAADDWTVRHANDHLNTHSEHIATWGKNAFLVTIGPEPVSANVVDISIDESYGHQFTDRHLKYGRREFEQELFRRYLHEPRVYTVILKRLGVL